MLRYTYDYFNHDIPNLDINLWFCVWTCKFWTYTCICIYFFTDHDFDIRCIVGEESPMVGTIEITSKYTVYIFFAHGRLL